MVFEQFLESKKIKKHFLYILLLGLFYVIISHFIADIFFKGENASIVIIFITTIFLIPSTYTLLKDEENIDAKVGLKSFFKNHKFAFKLYFALFIGIFIGFIIVNCCADDNPMSYQTKVLQYTGDVSENVTIDPTQREVGFNDVLSFTAYNTSIMLIAFVLSIFYGAGALFLLIMNASIFAAYISILFKNFESYKIFLASLHMIPELFGFFLAALAGGIISCAIFREKFGNDEFKNVVRDALLLLLLSFLIIIISAVLEVFVVINFFHLLI